MPIGCGTREWHSSLAGGTCIPSAVAHDLVHLVRLGDVQLAPLGHLLEVRAFVEGAAQSRFPGGWVRLVRALVVFALVDGPSLREERGLRWAQGLEEPGGWVGARSWGLEGIWDRGGTEPVRRGSGGIG